MTGKQRIDDRFLREELEQIGRADTFDRAKKLWEMAGPAGGPGKPLSPADRELLKACMGAAARTLAVELLRSAKRKLR